MLFCTSQVEEQLIGRPMLELIHLSSWAVHNYTLQSCSCLLKMCGTTNKITLVATLVQPVSLI